MAATPKPVRARDARWSAAADVLRIIRTRPGITRAALRKELNLSSGTATELTARLRDARLLAESPAPGGGRGRPTTRLHAHAHGPVVLAADLRADGWICVIGHVDGAYEAYAHGARTADPATVIGDLGRIVRSARGRFGRRLLAVSISVAGTVTGQHVIQASVMGWGTVDLAPLVERTPLALYAGNDATLAGVAEVRRGAARGAATALHLLVDVGIGGALTIGGQPLLGRTGAAGEIGHLPFGDPAVECPCGSRGCWDMEIDGRAFARHLGVPAPDNPRGYALDVLARSDGAAREAVARVATALGRGVAGLVNAHDPDVVTLGDLAPAIRAASGGAFDTAYRRGLMSFHRTSPPPVVAAAFGTDGGLQGAIDVGIDAVTSPSMLDAWAAVTT